MLMEFTPRDWFMTRIGLVLREGDPDPEDPWGQSYLHAQQLVPRHQVKEERNGIPCELLYFGQCYLGGHLQALQALYQRGLERSLLVEKLRELQRPQGGRSMPGLMELDDQALSHTPRAR